MNISCFLGDHFMLEDLLRVGAGLFLFIPFLFAPGYVIAWITGSFDFRKRRLIVRLLIGLVFSVGLFPFYSYVLWRFVGYEVLIFTYGVLFIVFIWLIILDLRKYELPRSKWVWAASFLTLIWVLVGVFSLIDLQFGEKVYYSVISYDYSARVPLTDAIFRTGVPPVNPVFYPGEPVSVSYYYLWYIMPALVSKLTDGFINPRIALSVSSIWVGIALRAISVLYLRLMSVKRGENIEARSVAVIVLLFVTGLDVIFAIGNFIQDPGNAFATEGWDGVYQVTAWSGSVLWVPNHVASMIACLTGFLTIESIKSVDDFGKRLLVAVLAALCFASAMGMSIYVASVFLIFGFLWLLISWKKENCSFRSIPILISGILALVFFFPFLYEITPTSSLDDPLKITNIFLVRGLAPIQFLLHQLTSNPRLINGLNFLLLPASLLAELGFFLVAGVIYYQTVSKNQWARERSLLSGILLLTSLSLASFVNPLGNPPGILNNLVVRGFLFAQFVLLIWSVEVFIAIIPSIFQKHNLTPQFEISKLTRKALLLLLILGFISSLADLLYLRFYFVVNDITKVFPIPGEGRPDRQIGQRTFYQRQAFCFIRDYYSRDIVVQHNPNVSDLERASALYSFRQMALSDSLNPLFLGSTKSTISKTMQSITPVFENPLVSLQEVKDVCNQFQIKLLLIKDLDPITDSPNSWLYMKKAIYDNAFMRIVECDW